MSSFATFCTPVRGKWLDDTGSGRVIVRAVRTSDSGGVELLCVGTDGKLYVVDSDKIVLDERAELTEET